MEMNILQILADTHTHTLASTHAYSTITENCRAAKQNGVKAIAMTDHTPAMPDAPHMWHFYNMKVIPRIIDDVYIIRGAETNIINFDGEVDLTQEDLKRLEWVVSSFHDPVCSPGSIEENTRAYELLARNPYIDVVGHPDADPYRCDYKRMVKAFKEHEKLIEINENSLKTRQGARKNSTEIARLCKKYGARIIVNSDAHYADKIGIVPEATKLLEGIDFPKELILNADWDRFKEYLINKRGNIFSED